MWIETLFQTPIGEYRKNALRLIIAPYLINIRKLSYEEAFNVAKDWLNLCGSIKRLDFNSERRIRENLNNAQNVGYLPIGFEKLEN
jgi:Primase X